MQVRFAPMLSARSLQADGPSTSEGPLFLQSLCLNGGDILHRLGAFGR